MSSKAYVLMAGTPAYMLAVWVLILAGLYLNGFRLLDVQSNSMEPIISQGDMLLMDKNEKRYTPGQVVAYRSLIDERVLITHRLVDEYQGGKFLATQGDALTTRDPLIPRNQIEGRVVAVLPMLGAVTAPFKGIYAINILIYALAVVIIAQELKRAISNINPAKYHLNHYSRAM